MAGGLVAMDRPHHEHSQRSAPVSHHPDLDRPALHRSTDLLGLRVAGEGEQRQERQSEAELDPESPEEELEESEEPEEPSDFEAVASFFGSSLEAESPPPPPRARP